MSEIYEAFSDIKLYKKSATAISYGDAIASYEKYLDISKMPQFFELDAGTYDFRLTAKINEKDYSENRTVTITQTPLFLSFSNLSPVSSDNTGSVCITFKINKSIFDDAIQSVTAKIDDGSEENCPVTDDEKNISGVFENQNISTGNHTINFLIKTATKTLMVYPFSAYVFANLTSKADFSLVIDEKNTWRIYNITYCISIGGADVYIQKYNPTSKILSFSETGLYEPNGKKFVCWSYCDDNGEMILNEGDSPTFEESIMISAVFLDYDTTNNAYKINDYLDLYHLLYSKLGTAENSKAILQNDINFNSYVDIWIPIKEYSGTFEGNDRVFSNISVEADDASFIQTLNGTIKNLTIKNLQFIGKDTAAPFASVISKTGQVQNCTSDANTIKAVSVDLSCAGGIVAKLEEKTSGTYQIISCVAKGGTVEADCAGRIVGKPFEENATKQFKDTRTFFITDIAPASTITEQSDDVYVISGFDNANSSITVKSKKLFEGGIPFSNSHKDGRFVEATLKSRKRIAFKIQDISGGAAIYATILLDSNLLHKIHLI